MYHLVLGREQIRLVLTGDGIGVDDDTLMLIMDLSGTDRVFQGITGQIFGVTHDIGDVIPFQLEHQLQVITDIITAQPLSER